MRYALAVTSDGIVDSLCLSPRRADRTGGRSVDGSRSLTCAAPGVAVARGSQARLRRPRLFFFLPSVGDFSIVASQRPLPLVADAALNAGRQPPACGWTPFPRAGPGPGAAPNDSGLDGTPSPLAQPALTPPCSAQKAPGSRSGPPQSLARAGSRDELLPPG